MFDFKPEHFSQTVSATRDFWIHVLKAKIEATVREEGDMIGWDDDEETVGPNALRAKQTLLEAVPRLLPEHNANVLYRLVLENGDFGIHNTSVSRDDQGKPLVTSLYDWEIACIVPAILAESLVAAGPIDLITNEYAQPAITRVLGSATVADIEGFEAWSEYYFKRLYEHAPNFEVAITDGKDIRHLWFALRDWRCGDSEIIFGDLGAWA